MADYIDREELLKSMQKKHHNLLKSHGVWSEYAYGFDSAMAMVSCQPTADVVEVRHGEWGDTGDFQLDTIYAGWKCSECGFIYCGGKFNYCPNCGAKMDGKGEGE